MAFSFLWLLQGKNSRTDFWFAKISWPARPTQFLQIDIKTFPPESKLLYTLCERKQSRSSHHKADTNAGNLKWRRPAVMGQGYGQWGCKMCYLYISKENWVMKIGLWKYLVLEIFPVWLWNVRVLKLMHEPWCCLRDEIESYELTSLIFVIYSQKHYNGCDVENDLCFRCLFFQIPFSVMEITDCPPVQDR